MAETCVNCGQTIGKLETGHLHNGNIVCGECIKRLDRPVVPRAAVATPAASAVAPAAPPRSVAQGQPVCQLCGSPMRKKVKSSGNIVGLALALIVFAIGVALCFTVVGAIIGIPLCILALFIGGKRTKIWQCTSCKSIAPRA